MSRLISDRYSSIRWFSTRFKVSALPTGDREGRWASNRFAAEFYADDRWGTVVDVIPTIREGRWSSFRFISNFHADNRWGLGVLITPIRVRPTISHTGGSPYIPPKPTKTKSLPKKTKTPLYEYPLDTPLNREALELANLELTLKHDRLEMLRREDDQIIKVIIKAIEAGIL